jgi:tetratricopeptide (TPR) repeat protein
LTREVRGELDWIVMKCLEKDRGRRYATANGLARDIQRFLSDEAVEAGPPSARYKLRKFARKHRKALGVAGVLAFTLAVASGVSIWQAIRATRAEGKALKEKERANEEAAIAKAVNEFLQVDLLAQADIRNQQGIGDRNKNITVRELLDRASRGIEAKFKAQELTEAAIRSTLGQAYLGLGELVEAQKHLERARDLRLDKLGAKHADTLDTMIALGNVYLESGRYDGAESLLQQAIETNEAEFGPHHDRTLYGMARLASLYWQRGPRDKAEPLYRQVLQSRIATLGRDHVYTLESMNSMAIVHSFYDRVAEAEALHKEVLSGYRARLGNDHPKTLTGIANLAGFYRNHRRPEEAEPLFKEVLDARRNHLGPDHPDTLQALSNFAMFHSDARRYKEAESMHKQVLEGRRKTLGPEHPHTYLSMIYLANQYVFQDRHEEAEPLYRSALEGRRKTLHPDHPETLTNMNNLACMLSDRRRFDEAVTLLEDGTERAKRTLGLGHAYTKDFINNLASANDGRRTPEAAAPYLRELDSYLRSQGQTDSLVFAKNAAWLCRGLVHEEKFAEAEAVGRASLAVLQEKQPNDWSTYDMRSLLGGSLLGQKRFDEAEKLLLQGHQGVKEREAKIPKHRKDRLIEGIERLVELYDAWGKEAEAAQWRKKLTDEKAKTK